MSDCTHDCSSCGESCAERQEGIPFQNKTIRKKKKKKKVKFCCQENAPTISSPLGFFRKSFVALKFSPKIFLKKYCSTFSFHESGGLSFFLFLLKNF